MVEVGLLLWNSVGGWRVVGWMGERWDGIGLLGDD